MCFLHITIDYKKTFVMGFTLIYDFRFNIHIR